MRRSILLVLSGAVYLTACADGPVAPPSSDAAAPEVAPRAKGDGGVATLGVLARRSGSTLVLEQRELDFQPASDMRIRSVRHEPSIGRAGEELRVAIDAATEIYVNGKRVSSPSEIPLRAQLLVAGRPQGGGLRARVVTDLSGMAQPTEAHQAIGDPSSAKPQALVVDKSGTAAAVSSLCLGQNMDYVQTNIQEFHGCWGGPSASDNFDIPDIPFACPVLGCFVVDEYSYTLALGGWAYDFPFRFSASASDLTYHVPGNVSLSVAALPASGTAFTFTGGLGFDYGLNVDFCWITGGCDDLGTFHISILSMIHQTTGAGPLKPAQTLQIAEVSCPSVGVFVIPNFPFDPLALGLCQDLNLKGRSFFTTVAADGATRVAEATLGFDGGNRTLAVRPDALQLNVGFSDFSWAPEMTMGFFFRLKSFGVTLVNFPTIPLTDGAFAAVSTPFPGNGDFTVATDPQSPVGSPSYLFQPTAVTVASLEVAPAPTTLAIISPATVPEGSPVRVRLTESYDGSPIAGALVRFTVTNASGSQNVFRTTDGGGVAQSTFANGEYSVTAHFAGSDFYLASSAGPQQVFVYRPTTFVIWGGNAGGLTLGSTYQFWGSEWYTQVAGGDFAADEDFKGFAHTVSGASWIGAGGNSERPPNALAELIGVIVTTSMTKDGDATVGNVAGRAILRVHDLDAYRANPGHQGYGALKAALSPMVLAGT